MALTDIVQKITKDAESSARQALLEAEKKATEILQKHEESDREMQKSSTEETARKKASMEQKIDAHLSMEMKSREATIKTKVLEKVKSDALKTLLALPDQKQQEMLKHILSSISESGTVHPAKGQKNLIQRAMQDAQKSFTLGEEVGIQGGFLFIGQTVDVDGSYETLLKREVLPKVETELSEMLFLKS